MASDIEYPHIFVPEKTRRYFFRPVTGGDGSTSDPPQIRNRGRHARAIKSSLQNIVDQSAQMMQRQRDLMPAKETGIYVKASARTDWGVAKSVPGGASGVDVLTISGEGQHMQTKFFMPARAIKSFSNAADKYAGVEDPDAKRPNYFQFFESIEGIEELTISDLWTSNTEEIPDLEELYEWEVWVRPHAEDRFRAAAERHGLGTSRDSAKFQEVTVLAAQGRGLDLATALWTSASAVELRPASRLMAEFFQRPRSVHRDAGNQIAAQIIPPPNDAPVVCLLDTGVNSAHPLLRGALNGVACIAAKQNWQHQDHHGHGTAMAGVATFGNLSDLVLNPAEVELTHGIESVTVLPQAGLVEPRELPATTVRRAVRLAERRNGNKGRVYCFAMSAPQENDDGRPTALSTMLDQLASEPGGERLFCVAAGNLDEVELRAADYLSVNDLSPIMAPGQAFNVLTVGACTNLDEVDPNTHRPLAGKGDLCPTARTAISWSPYMCHKPDIVMEGGNMAVDKRNRRVTPHEALSVLTTEVNIGQDLFRLTGDTSAATAAAARLAARVNAVYPDMWPETTKALLVHSARWTDAMEERIRGRGRNEDILHRFGYGVPTEERAIASARHVLTLIAQQEIRPLRVIEEPNSAGKMVKRVNLGEMIWHDLPWPKEALEQLGHVVVELRVTLCYFPPPNSAEVAQNRPDRYPGYSLTFDVKRPTERQQDAIKRVNFLERQRSGLPPKTDALNWTFGPVLRNRGSLQHDVWTGTAADLAEMGAVMVMPKKGWWSSHQDHWEEDGRYALVVSITSPTQEIEVYNQVEIEV